MSGSRGKQPNRCSKQRLNLRNCIRESLRLILYLQIGHGRNPAPGYRYWYIFSPNWLLVQPSAVRSPKAGRQSWYPTQELLSIPQMPLTTGGKTCITIRYMRVMRNRNLAGIRNDMSECLELARNKGCVPGEGVAPLTFLIKTLYFHYISYIKQ